MARPSIYNTPLVKKTVRLSEEHISFIESAVKNSQFTSFNDAVLYIMDQAIDVTKRFSSAKTLVSEDAVR